MKRITAIVATVLTLFFAGAASLHAQDPRAKWDQLSKEQREVVRQRFEMWKNLPKERRDEIARRQAEFENARAEAFDPHLPPPPRGPEADRRVHDLLKKKSNEILGRSGLSKEQIENLSTADLPSFARARALERLGDLEKRGIVDASEAARLRELPPPGLAKELRRLQKVAFLKSPPPAYLEIPVANRKTLEALPPEEFLKEVKRYLPRPPKGVPPPFPFGPPGREGPPPGPGSPPSEGGPPPDGPRFPRFAANSRFRVVKEWIDAHVTEEERKEIQSADPIERRQIARKILKAHARAALRERGLDERLVNETDVLPREDREIRLIQLIDRNFVAPPVR